jgi:hypothetical protein
LLIGNFNFGNPAMGPGRISAFDSGGTFLGLLKDTNSAPLSIDGLWTLTFGNGHSGGSSKVLYFSAGIQNQLHGVFGSLTTCGGPDISGASASPNVLWPPNHKMDLVKVNYMVNDNCDPTPVCSLSVSNNESGGGDSMVQDAHHVDLIAERAGSGDGRVYTVTISCQDKLGLSSDANVTVTVPHDQGKKK